MSEAVILASGQGPEFALGPHRVRVLAERDDYALAEGEFVAGGPAPPRHRHDWDEALYVLAGKLVVTVGDGTTIAWPGDFVLVPGGVLHTFATHGDEPARFLGFFGTGRALEYLRQLAAAGPPDGEAAAEIRWRFGVEVG